MGPEPRAFHTPCVVLLCAVFFPFRCGCLCNRRLPFHTLSQVHVLSYTAHLVPGRAGEHGTAAVLVRKLRKARAEAVTVNAGDAPKVISRCGAWLAGRWGWSSWSSKERPGNGSKPKEQPVTILHEIMFLLPPGSVSHSVLTMRLTFIEHLLDARHSSRCWEYNR